MVEGRGGLDHLTLAQKSQRVFTASLLLREDAAQEINVRPPDRLRIPSPSSGQRIGHRDTLTTREEVIVIVMYEAQDVENLVKGYAIQIATWTGPTSRAQSRREVAEGFAAWIRLCPRRRRSPVRVPTSAVSRRKSLIAGA